MGESGLIAIVWILFIALNLQADAGQTFVHNCSSYTVYKPTEKSQTWKEWKEFCQTENKTSALVSIETEEELIFLTKKLTEESFKYEYFIGLERRHNEWKWISGNRKEDTSYTFPWKGLGKDKCAKIYFKQNPEKVHYDDIKCGERYRNVGYICEMPVECQLQKETTTKPTTYPKSSAKKSVTTHSIPSVSQMPSRQPTGSKILFSSTSLIQDKSSSDLATKVHSRETATPPETSITGNPASTGEESSSQLIAIALTALGVIILVILVLLWFLFVRRPRSKAADSKTSQDVCNPHQQSSSQTAIDANMTPSEKVLDMYETVNEDKEEHTYDDVGNGNRKQRSAQNRNSPIHVQETSMQRQSKDEYCIPFDNVLTTEAGETPDSREGNSTEKEEKKDHVYAVVHVHADHGKATFTKDSCMQRNNVDLAGSSQQPFEMKNLKNNRNSSFSMPENPRPVTENVVAQSMEGENECHDYLYAVVDKANNKRKAPQMPAPYHNLVYADLSHSSQNKNDRINRASLSTVYAAIDYGKTGEIKSKLPEENMDQTVEPMAL